MSEDKPECQTCNGSGLEAPRTICRDCDEPFSDYLDNGNSGPVAARPSPTGEKVDAVPFGPQPDDNAVDYWKAAHDAADEYITTQRATIAALVAERDEARTKVEHFRTMYNTTVQTCQNRGRALAAFLEDGAHALHEG